MSHPSKSEPPAPRSATPSAQRLSRRALLRRAGGAACATPALLSGCTAANVLSEFGDAAERRERALTEGSVAALRDQGRALLVANLGARFGRPEDVDAAQLDSSLSLTFGRLGETYRSSTISSEIGLLGLEPWFIDSIRAGTYFLVSFAVRSRDAKFSASPGLPTFLDPKAAPAVVEFQLAPGDVAYLGHIAMHLDPIRREYFVETQSLPQTAREALTEERPSLVNDLSEKLFRCNGCPRF